MRTPDPAPLCDFEDARNACDRIRTELLSLGERDLTLVNADPVAAASIARGAVPVLAAFRDRIALLGDFDLGHVDKLPDYAKATWYLGASYLWHEIDGDVADVEITEPLAKAGLVFRAPAWHLSVNPYMGYGWQRVDTTVTTSMEILKQEEDTESFLYGISAYWRWRMLYANAKYYLEDNRDLDERYHVFRFWATAMITRSAGILGRFEYSETAGSTDTSALFGPVFVF